MMDEIEDPLQQIFAEHVDLSYRALDDLFEDLYAVVGALSDTLLSEHRIFVCGTGTGAALGQIFCASLLSFSAIERPALPAFCLDGSSAIISALAAQPDEDGVYARQISALGQAGDCLLVIAAAGVSDQPLAGAVRAAHLRDMTVLTVSSPEAGQLHAALKADELRLSIPAAEPARTCEVQLLVLNTLSTMLEKTLFGLI